MRKVYFIPGTTLGAELISLITQCWFSWKWILNEWIGLQCRSVWLSAGSVPIKLCQIQVRGWKHYQSFLSLLDETKKAITDSFVVLHLASFVVPASVTRGDPDPRRHLRSITALDDYRHLAPTTRQLDPINMMPVISLLISTTLPCICRLSTNRRTKNSGWWHRVVSAKACLVTSS